MRARTKSAVVALLSAALVLGGASAAMATIAYPPEGGTWDYGTSGSVIWSDYHHPSRSHGSSVENCDGNLTRSPTVLPGQWSHAQRNDGCTFAVDYAYYRVV